LALCRPCDNCGGHFVGAGAESCYDTSAPGSSNGFCSSECLLSFAVRGCADDDTINEALQTICGLACSFENRKTTERRRAPPRAQVAGLLSLGSKRAAVL
jgi:hypothetical protein